MEESGYVASDEGVNFCEDSRRQSSPMGRGGSAQQSRGRRSPAGRAGRRAKNNARSATETPPTKKGKQAKRGGGKKLEDNGEKEEGGSAPPPAKKGKRKLEEELGAKGFGKSARRSSSVGTGAAKKRSKADTVDPKVVKFWAGWLANPPQTMAMTTHLNCALPEMWATEEGAKYASDCREEMDVCRLIGTTTLQFQVSPEKREEVLRKLSADVKAVRRDVKLNNMVETGVQTWNSEGEPGSSRCITIKRLLDACEEGDVVANEECKTLLAALHDLIKPDAAGLPWKPQPLLRVVCPLQATSSSSSSSSAATASSSSDTVTVTAFVYIRRLLFFLIAYPPIRKVMRHVTPSAPVRPTVSLPALDPPLFLSHDSFELNAQPPDYRFSLQGIMKSQEHPGYRRAVEPEGLNLRMKDYQLQTLQWMLDREALEHGLNSLFWEERQFPGGGVFYYAPALGELRLERPSDIRGGILSEEMGLGKTLEILSLILAAKQQKQKQQQQQRRRLEQADRKSVV